MIGNNIVRVQAGALWKDVLEFLDPLGKSVSIMQSDFDFSIGGTLSANVHGWAIAKPPFVSSVVGFHIILSNGKILYCSREQNKDLFKCVNGGYGLFGIVTNVDLRITDNKIYKLKKQRIPSKKLVSFFLDEILGTMEQGGKKRNLSQKEGYPSLFYARFQLDHSHFLKNVLTYTYYEDDAKTHLSVLKKPLTIIHPIFSQIFYFIFEQTAGDTFYANLFKKFRFWMEEKIVDSNLFSKDLPRFSRNQILYQSVVSYFNRDQKKLDLIQEYFIPLEFLNQFIDYLMSLQKELEPYLLNITVRYVKKDTETLLNYAKNDSFGFVMIFRGKNEPQFEEKIKLLAQKMTNQAIKCSGTYYLPYRLWQTQEQFIACYSNYKEFIKLKNNYDPLGLFSNKFYEHYLKLK
jgi:hypothetical protein